MSYWTDPDFQKNLIAFLTRDRSFLKKTSGLLEVDDFKPRKGQSNELHLLAELALKFWRQYDEPVGGMLRTEVLDMIREQKLGSRLKQKLLDVVDEIRANHNLIAVEALEQKVIQYKSRRAKQQAIDELIALQEKGNLTDERFLQICQNALHRFGHGYKITDYLTSLEKRIRRRQLESLRKFPYLLIDQLDRDIRSIPRGSFAIALSKWNVGKSLFLTHIAYASALQGYNVLFVTLEDPKSEVEDRLDGLLTGLPIRRLADIPRKLRRRFKRAKEKFHARIKIVDGTEGGFTVQKIEDIWERLRNRGFVADVVIVDYDDEIAPTFHHKGESARRMEFADIYRDMRKFAARKDIYLWSAAQARRGKDNQQVVKGDDAAEDISKIRKVALCIGIGNAPKNWGQDGRHLFVARHRFDRAKIGWNIMGDFKSGIFYAREATIDMLKKTEKQEKAEED